MYTVLCRQDGLKGQLTWLRIECLASGSCVGSALCSAADRRLMNNFGMCAGALQNIHVIIINSCLKGVQRYQPEKLAIQWMRC